MRQGSGLPSHLPFFATPHLERLSVMVVPWSPVDLGSLSHSHPHLRYLQVDSKIDPY